MKTKLSAPKKAEKKKVDVEALRRRKAEEEQKAREEALKAKEAAIKAKKAALKAKTEDKDKKVNMCGCLA